MGGQSYSTVTVEHGLLNFTGRCAIVPSLQAPGFITAVSGNQRASEADPAFSDVSSCEGLKINAKSVNAYGGFGVSFGHAHPIGGKFFAYGYKAHFSPTVGSYGDITVPVQELHRLWDDATGEPIHKCTDVPRYCPDVKTLTNMKTMSIWAEGVEGDVQLLCQVDLGIWVQWRYDCVNARTLSWRSCRNSQGGRRVSFSRAEVSTVYS